MCFRSYARRWRIRLASPASRAIVSRSPLPVDSFLLPAYRRDCALAAVRANLLKANDARHISEAVESLIRKLEQEEEIEGEPIPSNNPKFRRTVGPSGHECSSTHGWTGDVRYTRGHGELQRVMEDDMEAAGVNVDTEVQDEFLSHIPPQHREKHARGRRWVAVGR